MRFSLPTPRPSHVLNTLPPPPVVPPAPSEEALIFWSKYVLKMKNLKSKSLLATQRRFLWALQVEDPFPLFSRLVAGLAPTTKATYWAAIASLRSCFLEKKETYVKTVGKKLDAEAMAAPLSQAPPMSLVVFRKILLEERSEAKTIVALAFVLGQRTSDVAQLHYRDVVVKNVMGKQLIVVTVRRGKVIQKIGAFTVAMPFHKAIAADLEFFAKGQTFLFSATNSVEERDALGKKVKTLLNKHNLQARSVRRGGLQLMAQRCASGENSFVLETPIATHASEIPGCGSGFCGPDFGFSSGGGRDLFWTGKHKQFLVSEGWGKNAVTSVAKSVQDYLTPLHVKPGVVGNLAWCDLDRFMATRPSFSLWKCLTSFYRDASVLENLFSLSPLGDDGAYEAQLCENDMSVLLRNGCVTEVREAKGWCRVFSVFEKGNTRRRLILWPKKFNDLTADSQTSEVVFPTVEDIIGRVDKKRAACLDFAAFFQQFPLAAEVRVYFCFRWRGKIYAPTTIPTGGREPPKFAQLLTREIALDAADAGGPPDAVDADAFIDNVRLAGDVDGYVRGAVSKVFSTCRNLGIIVNEKIEEVTPQTSYTFLGIYFAHEELAINVGEKTKNKLREQMSILEKDATCEAKQWWSLFGLCVWGSKILGLPKHKYYYVYKFIRRSAADAPSKQRKIWNCLVSLWRSWCVCILESGNVKPTKDVQSSSFLFTDASSSGFGAILFCPNGDTRIVAGAWAGKCRLLHINVLELRAVHLALSLLNLCNASLFLFVDNTTAQLALIKTRSKSFSINQEVGRILSRLAELKSFFISVNYVSTHQNPADYWSRLVTKQSDGPCNYVVPVAGDRLNLEK